MRVLFLVGTLLFSGALAAETAYIDASKDNTLYESETGATSNGEGDFFFSGLTMGGEIRRGLIAFENLGPIPQGATIQSVKLHLNMSREDSDPANIDLVRVQTDWGEGTSDAISNEGQGAAAEMGDATWLHSFYDNQTWMTPGGDFAEVASASLMVDAVGSYTFESSQMVADVQDWLENPNSNFGWILIGDEEDNSTKRFDSRSNPDSAFWPILEVEYSATGSMFDFSGPWYDPALDGEGYLIYETPYGWLIYYFGYSADNERLWLVSEIVTLDQLVYGEPFELPMLVGIPGTFSMPTPSSDLIPWGTLTVIFYSCTTGEFTLDGTDGLKVSDVIKLTNVEDTVCLDL